MHALLGLDAAWTPKTASGVALLVGDVGNWRCLRVAPSRRAFVAQAGEAPVDFGSAVVDDDAPLHEVIAVACSLAGVSSLSVLAVDMPLAVGPIVGRRAADNCVSREYGARGCAVHSPTPARPGPVAERLRDEALACDLPLVTRGPPRTPALIEVYPHVSLLQLLGASYRVGYKVSRARKYWPGRSRLERVGLLLEAWRGIEGALARVVEMPVREAALGTWSTRMLKAYEDALDGAICAWTAALYLEGRTTPLGDDDAAIWVPSPTPA